jgi:hypothetical protein
VATYLIGEGKINSSSRGRMPGLCDYHANLSTFNLVEYTFDIDVRRWQRREFLIPNTTFLTLWRTDEGRCCSLRVRVMSESQVRLIYRVRMPGKRWQRKEQPVGIVWDSCRYGGRRPWLLCPVCRRRVAVLHLGGISPLSFSCRRCAKLTYECERSGPRLRSMRKAQKLRRQLGGSDSLSEPFPEKPRAMHEKRYSRIKKIALSAEDEWFRRSAYLFRALEREPIAR